MPSPLRQRLVWIGWVLCLGILGYQIVQLFRDPFVLPSLDFAMFWATGRLNAYGENPYDPEKLLPLEREVTTSPWEGAVYTPPWTLTLVMPFGILDPRISRILWLFMHFSVLILCTDWAWRLNELFWH